MSKSGTGQPHLNTANTYSGGTTLNGGTLNVNHASALGTGSLTIAAGTKIDNTVDLPSHVHEQRTVPGTVTSPSADATT